MKIVVLAGGISTERDVSLVSGMGIYKALLTKGHQVMLLDVFLGYEGEDWAGVFDKDCDWSETVDAIKEENPDLEAVKASRPGWEKDFFGPHVLDICRMADIVFMALHGENGENGKIQACFDLNGIVYTGTDHVSSAICMDKGITKDLFRAYQIPTPAGVRFSKRAVPGQNPVPYPCIVKACCGGSSVGVMIAHDEDEYEKALKEAFRYDDEVVVEQYIKGREFSVSVVDGKAYPIIEIAPISGFYDYKNKYQAGATIETCPAELSAEKTGQIQRMAEKAFEALRLRAYARFDLMMDEAENFYFLEANTLPGMTSTSLMPQEAQALGIGYANLCQLLIDLSLRRA
jgi:D-alanine-D-alanine ligase